MSRRVAVPPCMIGNDRHPAAQQVYQFSSHAGNNHISPPDREIYFT